MCAGDKEIGWEVKAGDGVAVAVASIGFWWQRTFTLRAAVCTPLGRVALLGTAFTATPGSFFEQRLASRGFDVVL